MSSARVKALHEYGIFGTPEQPEFDRFVAHAADLFDAPMAALNFIDEDRQWTKASVGAHPPEIARDASFCTHTIQDAAPLVIQDATEDERFSNRTLVVEPPHVRFYAGAPLVTPEGYCIGTLCVLDTEPRSAADFQVRRLERLANMAMDRLEQRRRALQREQELRASRARYRTLASHFPNGIVALFDKDLHYQLVYGEGLAAHDVPPESLKEKRVPELFDEPLSSTLATHYQEALRGNASVFEVTHRGRRHRMHVVPVEGEEPGGMVMSQDITEFEEDKHQLETLVENLPGIVYRARPEAGRPLECVKGDVEGMTGYGADTLPDQFSFRTLIHPDDYQDEEATVDESIEQAGHYDLTFRIQTKHGTTKWLRDRGIKVEDPISGEQKLEGLLTDVTARIHDQETLHEREEWLHDISDSLPGFAFQFVLDADGNHGVQFVGNSAERLLGIPANPDRYEEFLAYIPASHRRSLAASIREAIAARDAWEQEFPYDHPQTGERVWLHAISVRAETTTETKAVYNGVVIDITARKKRETEQKAARERMELALEKTDAVLFEVDLVETTVTRAGPFERLFGMDRSDVPNLDTFISKIVHPDDQASLRAFFERLKTGTAQSIDYRTHPDRGPMRWIRGTVHRLERTEAGVKRLIGIERDVTARKEAEQERRMLAAAVEHASEAVLITEAKPLDHPGPRIVYANPAFESMTGYETDEVIGLTPRILQGPDTDPAVLREFRTRLENEQPFWAETVNYRKDGTPYMVHWDVAPVYNNSGELEYWVSVQHDVTEERRREEELRAAKEEAEKAARLKEAMLANMSHEVRTPLTSMMGFAQVLADELEGSQAKHAEIIHQSGKRLQKTLESMLQLSELHGGAYEPSWERADLREVAAEVVETMRPRAAAEDLTLEVAYPGRPVNARIDLIATQRIITNLLDNAIKFTPAEGKVTLQVDQEDEVPYVCVQDTGIGIAEGAIDEMFVAFKQESEGLSRSYEGSGLGLAIVKQLVEETGGVITVESTKGEGTRIQVRFPETASQDVKTLDGVDSV